MDWYKPLAKNFVIPLHAAKCHSPHLRYLAEYERTQYFPRKEILKNQFLACKSIVRYAYDHCPYYREKYTKFDIHPEDLCDPDSFLRLPVLEKREIQEHWGEMVARNLSRDQMIENFTGGSTGKPLSLYHDVDRQHTRTAGMLRHDRWAGWDLGDKIACLWGASRDLKGLRGFKAWLRNLLIDRALFLDTSFITEEKMADFVTRLKMFRPAILLAYANSLDLFARYLKEKGLSGSLVLKGIISSAEVLTENTRKLAESVFKCKVFNRYGCREASVLASECEHHQGMHINAESVYLEFVRGDNPVKSGELGEVLLTDLRNIAMPHIRYRIGDMGIPSEEICQCGRGLPLMVMAAGRVTDFLVTPDGGLVSGVVLSTYLITNVRGLQQIQFYQENSDSVLARVVTSIDSREEVVKDVRRLIPEFMRNVRMKVDFDFVQEIPREASGKFRFTVSRLDPMAYL